MASKSAQSLPSQLSHPAMLLHSPGKSECFQTHALGNSDAHDIEGGEEHHSVFDHHISQ
jgi:hypothetical protein